MTAKDLLDDIADPRHKKNNKLTISAVAEKGELYSPSEQDKWKASVEAMYKHKNTEITFKMSEKSMRATIKGSWEW